MAQMGSHDQERKCGACGESNAANDRFCGGCGGQLVLPAAPADRGRPRLVETSNTKPSHQWPKVVGIAAAVLMAWFTFQFVLSQVRNSSQNRDELIKTLPSLRDSANGLSTIVDKWADDPAILWDRDLALTTGMDLPDDHFGERWQSLNGPIKRLKASVTAFATLPRRAEDISAGHAQGLGGVELTSELDKLTAKKARLVESFRAAAATYRSALDDLAKANGVP